MFRKSRLGKEKRDSSQDGAKARGERERMRKPLDFVEAIFLFLPLLSAALHNDRGRNGADGIKWETMRTIRRGKES